jgi:hypothetical protein
VTRLAVALVCLSLLAWSVPLEDQQAKPKIVFLGYSSPSSVCGILLHHAASSGLGRGAEHHH